jgi:hypothetical protein
MLMRFLRLRAVNRMLAFELPSVLKVFKNEAGGNPSKNGHGRGASDLSAAAVCHAAENIESAGLAARRPGTHRGVERVMRARER